MPKRVDQNQAAIVQVLRQLGASVLHTHDLGKGAPDLIVAYGGRAGSGGVTTLVEIKNGELSPSRQRLTEDEQLFHDTWRGEIVILRSVNDAVTFIQGMT